MKCPNCDSFMRWFAENQNYQCEMCGYSQQSKSDENEVKYIG